MPEVPDYANSNETLVLDGALYGETDIVTIDGEIYGDHLQHSPMVTSNSEKCVCVCV